MKKSHSVAALKYAEDVVSGEIIACNLVKLSCQRFIDDLRRDDLIYDETAAQRAINIIHTLEHVKGSKWARKPFLLEPWQKFIVCNLFGFKWRDGRNRFHEAYCEIPRKNGKSPFAAAIGIVKFIDPNEFGSEVYSGATTEKQAWEVYRPAKLMMQKAHKLREQYGITVNAKTAIIEQDYSRFEPIIGKPGDGASASCAIVDEYHEHQTQDLYDTMVDGMVGRENPLALIITTAGSSIGGPCHEKRADCIKILEGNVKDDSVFAIIFALDDGDRWDTEDALIKANPNWGVSVYPHIMLPKLDKARRSASAQASYRTKHLNEWLGSSRTYINMVAWQRQSRKMKISDFAGEPCHVAVDLSTQNDVSSVAATFKRDGHYFTFCKHFVPEGAFHTNDRYRNFALGGYIETTQGNAQDYGAIKVYIEHLANTFTVRSVSFDPWQSHQMMQELIATGLEVFKFTQQLSSYSDPAKWFETLVLDGKFWHADDDPVLTWMVGNMAVYTSMDMIRPIKGNPNSPNCKIDGGIATIMTLRAYQIEAEEPYVVGRLLTL